MMFKQSTFYVITSAFALNVFAQTEQLTEEVLVLGSQEDYQNAAGSAQYLDREALEDFEYTDVNQVLAQVPGVYIRQEDGYGLRPNIGLRGVTSDRSQKITIMEDGILITPAPYSAPAAYYIPNVNRMQAVEVFKGPASIKFGPNTVGGAINFATRPVPQNKTAEVDLSYGSYNYQKYRALYGETLQNFGYLIEGLRYSADGFKELDSDKNANTGFERNDINARLMWQSDADASFYQRLELKLGYADETSNETYLGLTEADFDDDALRRYSASSEDEFTSTHSQLHLIHTLELNDLTTLTSRAYYNNFQRDWIKFDGFIDDAAPEAKEILSSPELYPSFIGIIRGDQDSGDQAIDVTNNAREYGSQGLSIDAVVELDGATVSQSIEAGLRYHYDYVQRDHKQYAFDMQSGRLQNKRFQKFVDDNKDQSVALSAYINDTLVIDKWRINLGARLESIDSERKDDLDSNNDNDRSHTEFLPGVGVFYSISDQLGVLLGVNKGFSPNGPGASDDVDPEQSINYEWGVRYNREQLKAEVIGFFSDYSNLIGRCRA
ncbi:MAG: TonB-dependent receptor, partial [Pseudomonadales bacterium]|nr:TonB-dependent receptor [Pseudomonadales bacterium]